MSLGQSGCPEVVRSPAQKHEIMGVLNVTPDSFSDGDGKSARWRDPGEVMDRALGLIADGADIIDIGAESTRPGAEPVDETEEWGRLFPILSRLTKANVGATISVDTRKPSLMLKAADQGALIINDVGGGAPEQTLTRLAAYPGMQYIAMHMHMNPKSMQQHPLGAHEASALVSAFFSSLEARLLAAGFPKAAIWLDPGIGFGKTDAANLTLMQMIHVWSKGFNIAVGVSRKSLIGRALGIGEPKDRDAPSKTLELGLAMLGARRIRTHAVAPLRRLLDLLQANGPETLRNA